ncbi:MAG: TRAP transporter large permease [Oscillospiraceae bacterium]|nr:TRAP transporter large permease [Oscillospiraceae bacterium]
MDIVIMLVILIGLIVLNVPIYIALLAAGLYLQVFVNDVAATTVITGMYEALTKTSLMAVPFFVFAGSIMAHTSLGKRLINVFAVLLRPFKAGLAFACLIANAFFGAISGSAPAATATFGKVTYKPLTEQYDENLASGLITSSGALSVIIPPSISIILFAIAAELSTTKLFLTGILPGILLVVIVGVYLAIRCRKLPRQPAPTKKEVGTVLKEGIPVLIMPVIILGGIYSGVFTPTESAAVAAVYSLIASIFWLKDLRGKQLIKVLKEATITTSQIFILVAASTVFAQALTVAQVQNVVTNLLQGVGRVEFLLLLNLVLLIVGCFIDGGCAILILVPIVLPISGMLGIDPLHLGIVFVINLAIGLFTPPFGLNIFVSQSVLGRSLGSLSKSLVPYIICYLIALLLVTFIPQISLCLV